MADSDEKFLFGEFTAASQCVYCKHRAKPSTLGVRTSCAAFPGGIPDPILDNTVDHRQPIEGDEGMGEPGTHVLFEPREGVPEAILARLYAVLDEA